mgnify:FL=1
MISSKAISLIQTFSKDEFKEFGLFLDSPFHNKDKILLSLYRAIGSYYPSFRSTRFTKKNIFAKIYPGKKYNDSRMRNLLSDLLRSAKDYLTLANIIRDRARCEIRLLDELIQRMQPKVYEKDINRLFISMQEETVCDQNYYEKKYLLERLHLEYSKRFIKDDTKIDEIKFEIYETLRIYFLISSMYLETEISNSSRDRFSYRNNVKQREDLEKYLELEAEAHSDIVYVKYYYNMYKLGRTQEKKYFYALREVIKNDYEKLNETDRRNIFTALTNYCYYAANKGDTDLYKDHFELYKEHIEKGYYALGKYMTSITYFNTVVTGLEVNEFS